MITDPELDREHVLGVCATVITYPSVRQSSSEQITLAFVYPRESDKAVHALRRSGYITADVVLGGHLPCGVRVTGWSTDRLERRTDLLRTAADRYGTNALLQQTAARAIDAAAAAVSEADHPADADPVVVALDVASKITDRMIGDADLDGGQLVPLTRFPADPQLGDQLREVQRLIDQVCAVLGDHFNVACVAASTYIHTRGEQPGDKPADRADEAAARDDALAESRAFIANPAGPDAFVEAVEWAHQQDLDDIGAFALDYGRTYRGTAREQRPLPEQAYPAWRDAQAPNAPAAPPESPANQAAADFPDQPLAQPGPTAPAARPDSASTSPTPGSAADAVPASDAVRPVRRT